MKMVKITKGVTSDFYFFHTLPNTYLTDFFHKLQFYECSLKYETPMFQEFITCLFDNSLFPIWVYVNSLFFNINCFFFKGIVRFQCFLS